MKKKYDIVQYKNGYMPKDNLILNKKINDLIDNPPIFDIKNKNEISRWLKDILDLYKSKK